MAVTFMLLILTVTTVTYGSCSYDPILLDAILHNQELFDNGDQLSDGTNDQFQDNGNGNSNNQFLDNSIRSSFRQNNNNDLMAANFGTEPKNQPSIRDRELIQHSSSLWGHQYVQGGAGEGDQRLKPDGSLPNVQVIKSDSVLPAYCDPPNPCPIGYSSEDYDCLDTFTNSAAFSREYQGSQECMCDQEHMFDCPVGPNGQMVPEPDTETQLDTIARSLSNNGDLRSFIGDDKRAHLMVDSDHRVVAKKYFSDADHMEHLNELKDQTNNAWRSKVKRGKDTVPQWQNSERTPFVMAKKSPEIFD